MTSGLRSGVRAWPGFRSEYAWLGPHEGDSVTKPRQIGVGFTPHRGLVQAHDGREREMDVAPGSVFVTGEAPIRWRRVREPTEALEIYPDEDLIAAVAGQRAGEVRLRPQLQGGDPVVFSAAARLRAAHTGGRPLSDVGASQIGLDLVRRLITVWGDPPVRLNPLPGRLDDRRLGRVRERVEAGLAGPLSVQAMAAAAGLTPAHFSRCFRRSTGLSPAAWTALIRMERARDLLLGTRLSADAIGEAVGYSNLSHFRRVFRSAFGVPPSALRASASLEEQDSTAPGAAPGATTGRPPSGDRDA